MDESLKPYKVLVEVTLSPGITAEAVVYVDAASEDEARDDAYNVIKHRLRVKSVELDV